MGHRIEAAKSGRAACATCGEPIAKGEVRVAELYQDTEHGPQRVPERYQRRGERADREPIYRFHHLACAATAVPAVVRSALNAPHDHALIADRPGLDARVAAAMEVERKQRVEAATAKLLPVAAAPSAADVHLAPLLAQLADDPEDATVLQVIGDLFAGRGDPQGELISIQLALRAAKPERGPEVVAGARTGARDREVVDSTSATLVRRRDELMGHLAPRLDAGDRATWGTGFVRRLELGEKSSARLLELAALWRHPVLPVLQELHAELPAQCEDAAILAQLLEVLPRSLRRLEIGGGVVDPAPLARLVAGLPRLVHLALHHRPAGPELAHPTLAELVLAGRRQTDTIVRLSREALPALRSVAFREWYPSDEPLAALARSGWLAQLDRVHLDTPGPHYDGAPPLAIEAAEALRAGLAGRTLARLEITACPVPLPVRAILTPCCIELICPTSGRALDDATTHVEHTGKPEWGRGKIVKRHDGKLEVKFPKAGVKVFRVDAPFLRPVAD